MKLHDRVFRPLISAAEIDVAVGRLAARLDADYGPAARGEKTGCDGETARPPLLLGVLNGSFMFLAALAGKIEMPVEVSFVKFSSYDGLASTGLVRQMIGLDPGGLAGRDVIVVEDIVETGNTLEPLLEAIRAQNPASVEVAAMFFKPEAFRKDFEIKYRGMEVEDGFIVGFGLDYNELGRNLRDVYVVEE